MITMGNKTGNQTRSGAGQYFANEGRDLASGAFDALGDRLGNLIRGGSSAGGGAGGQVVVARAPTPGWVLPVTVAGIGGLAILVIAKNRKTK